MDIGKTLIRKVRSAIASGYCFMDCRWNFHRKSYYSIFLIKIFSAFCVAFLILVRPSISETPNDARLECRSQLAFALLRLHKRFYEIETRERNITLWSIFVAGASGGNTVVDIDEFFQKTFDGKKGCEESDVKEVFELSPYFDNLDASNVGVSGLLQCCGFEVTIYWERKSQTIRSFRAHADMNIDNDK